MFKKIINLIAIVMVFIVLFAFFMFYNFAPKISLFMIEKLVNSSENCEGIEYFYTNKSFEKDVKNFLNKVYLLEEENETFSDLRFIIPPIDLYEDNVKGKFDCEDISSGISCLSKLYNITYTYYIELVGTNNKELEEQKKLTNHLGIYCKICLGRNKQRCEWRKYN